MPQPKIKVFWDLVSCPPPAIFESPWEVLKDIRLFTSNFGIVTSIKAYWDRNKAQHADPIADPFRAAIPSMGVNLIDCSTMQGYTGDALTKMLTVDVLISAMDDPVNVEAPENDIILIISGDESVLYPISLLMFRNHTIFLTVPDEKDNIEPFQATRVLKWHRDVLGYEFNLSPEPTSVPVEESPEPPLEGWAVHGTHIPQLNPESISIPVAKSPGPPSEGWVVNGTRIPQLNPESIPIPVAKSPKPPSEGWIVNGTRIPQLSLDITTPESPSGPSGPNSGASAYKSPPRPANPITTATTPATSGGRPGSIPSPEPSASRAPSALSWSSGPGTTAKRFRFMCDEDVISGSNTSTSSRPSQEPSKLREGSQLPPGPEEDADDDWRAVGDWKPGNPSAGWEMTDVDWASEPKPAPKVERKTQPAKPATPKVPPTRVRTSGPTKSPRSSTSGRKNSDSEVPIDPPLSAFEPLLQVLRDTETHTMLRSQLGEQLANRHRGLYLAAGVRGLGEYVTLAAKKNLVTLLGVDNHQQVKLKEQ